MIRVSKQSLPDIHDLPFGVTEVATNRPKMASELIYRWLLPKVAQILQIRNDERRVERMKPIEVAASPVRNLAYPASTNCQRGLGCTLTTFVTTASLMGALETIRSRSRDTLPARGAASPAAVVSISERCVDASCPANGGVSDRTRPATRPHRKRLPRRRCWSAPRTCSLPPTSGDRGRHVILRRGSGSRGAH
jgi:hypothetical protein